MFRHMEYVNELDYPFNAGYVIFSNYFFPQTETGESSTVPLKEFPKAFKDNFEYFVTNDLTKQERDIVYKTFKDKKSYKEVADDLGISNKALTAARTRAFVKLRNTVRSKYILSDDVYVPKTESKDIVSIGDVTVESVLKSPDSITGGGDFRLITVRNGKSPMFSVRVSAKMSSEMSNDDLNNLVDKVAEWANNYVSRG